ncbi:RDD family protein [Microbacterium sp. NPDC087591]|uniref:RDD family protein n=1 Tax=Microbacterium sp. NPDC087591 TaxID=3364192 RepID=UPI003816E8A4
MTLLPFGQVAPISRRAVAYIIDALIAGGLGIVLGGGLLVAASLAGGIEGTLTTLLIGGPIVSLVLLAWFVVYTLMQAGNGSIGMRAQGLRLASATDGKPLGFGRALLRNIIFGLAGAIVVGYFSPLFDGSGRFQGWHDKVGNALMLDARVEASAPSTMLAPGAPTSLASAAPATSAAPVVPGLPHPSPRAGAPFAPPASLPAPGFGQPTPAAPVVASPPAPAPAPASAAPAPAPAPAAPAAPAAPIPDAGDLIAFVPGITQDSAPARATPAPEQAPPAPAPAPAAPAAPAPVVSAPAAAASAAPAPAPSVPAAPAPAVSTPAFEAEESDVEDTRISIPGHRLVFTWDDGTRVSVSRRTIFGRNPGPEDGAIIVSVRDETLSLSKTHFEAAAEASGGWVLDRHSTNGMTIVRDGQRIACPAGQRVPVRLGDAIEIGDRIVTIGGYA